MGDPAGASRSSKEGCSEKQRWLVLPASQHRSQGRRTAVGPSRAQPEALMETFSLMWRLWVPVNTLRDRHRATPSAFEGISLQRTPGEEEKNPNHFKWISILKDAT